MWIYDCVVQNNPDLKHRSIVLHNYSQNWNHVVIHYGPRRKRIKICFSFENKNNFHLKIKMISTSKVRCFDSPLFRLLDMSFYLEIYTSINRILPCLHYFRAKLEEHCHWLAYFFSGGKKETKMVTWHSLSSINGKKKRNAYQKV